MRVEDISTEQETTRLVLTDRELQVIVAALGRVTREQLNEPGNRGTGYKLFKVLNQFAKVRGLAYLPNNFPQ